MQALQWSPRIVSELQWKGPGHRATRLIGILLPRRPHEAVSRLLVLGTQAMRAMQVLQGVALTLMPPMPMPIPMPLSIPMPALAPATVVAQTAMEIQAQRQQPLPLKHLQQKRLRRRVMQRLT